MTYSLFKKWNLFTCPVIKNKILKIHILKDSIYLMKKKISLSELIKI